MNLTACNEQRDGARTTEEFVSFGAAAVRPAFVLLVSTLTLAALRALVRAVVKATRVGRPAAVAGVATLHLERRRGQCCQPPHDTTRYDTMRVSK